MSMTIIDEAKLIARKAHEGQYRSWSNNPYFVHCERVANRVVKLPWIAEEDIAAAYLHDVLEDVAIPQSKLLEYSNLILEKCGTTVLNLVLELTKPSVDYPHLPRAKKLEMDWKHLDKVSDRAKRIKLVDRIDNVSDMEGASLNFMRKYADESGHLMILIGNVDLELAKELDQAIFHLDKRCEAYEDNPS